MVSQASPNAIIHVPFYESLSHEPYRKIKNSFLFSLSFSRSGLVRIPVFSLIFYFVLY